MCNCAAEDLSVNQSNSAIEGLQLFLLSGHRVSGRLIKNALLEDVSNHIPINGSFFYRYVKGNPELGPTDLEAMIQILREGMSAQLLINPETFLSYAQAAVLCVQTLQDKGRLL